MGSPRITPDQKRKFIRYLGESFTVKEAAERAGFAYITGRRLAAELAAEGIDPKLIVPARQPLVIPQPLTIAELTPIAKDCLDDFARFRRRYFGRISSPWQEDAAQRLANKLSTPFKEFIVVNCPPGSGKSTLFSHDIPAWLTCRSRSIRGFIGTNTQVRANGYVGRLRSTLERRIPVEAKSEDRSRQLAVDAASTLSVDYGRFRPDQTLGDPPAPWTQTQLTVVQHGFTATDEKEATWTAFGEDTGFLGWRVNFIVWDDVVTKKSLTTEEVIMAQRQWWLDEAQTRLEPGGLLVLQGQRLGAEDLYRFCLDMEAPVDDLLELIADAEELGEEVLPREKKYHHIIYKAHYEDRCQYETSLATRGKTIAVSHRSNAQPYDPSNSDSGCLLDPVRLPWRELKQIMEQPMSNFRVVYQQEDTDPKEVLVPRVWIDGGKDFEGNLHPGCWDDKRGIAVIPQSLTGTKLSVVTVDPSPTKFWSVQWWLYVQPQGVDRLMGNRYLLDIFRNPMDAPDLLDWNVGLGTWTGLLVDWQERAKKLHCPIDYLIVERNAAQRFLLQYEWFKRWTGLNNITIRPHSTTVNKSDEEYGVKTIKSHYRFGRVRLPGTPDARRTVEPLVTELTRYPDSTTDDCVMANWFLEYQLQYLVRKANPLPPLHPDMPMWLNRDVSGF